MNTKDIKIELKQKERYISDLLRFIKTRNDNNPNYSLLLGAGCSVTSNIRSGGELINEWRKEIYLDISKNDEDANLNSSYLEDDAINYLSEKCASWYNKSNEYSSLFEKKYDLPRQRRMFIEKEVSNKKPSIGYSYLVNLVKASYFNTIFTTNFDDLINEAFYQFSEVRPMICAHDSSIKSITVTSKRPKVIKLHGDYLFDDIKSTLRETESLEDNIRNKFIEFAKDYGLIVVGYGGHDRSIMDVINYLLKHEDYYKNGIYWCLRKGDVIGEDLRKLLWKDRVYFVEIDGYDELFAELHSEILKKKLPIDTHFISNKSQDIIQRFIKNKFLENTESKVIKEDLKNLKIRNEKNSLYDAIKNISSDNFSEDDTLDNKEVKSLIDISNLYNQDQYIDSLKLIEEAINKTNNKNLKIELLKKNINIHIRLNEENKAINVIDKLIDIDDRNPKHYLIRSKLDRSFGGKVFWIDKAISIDSYYEDFYNHKASLYTSKYDFVIKNTDDFDQIINILDKSIEVSPSIENDAWVMKFDFLLKNNPKDPQLNSIITALILQRPYSITVLELKYDLINNDDERKEFINHLNEIKSKCSHDDKLKYELLILRVRDDLNEKNKIEDALEFLSIDKSYMNKISFLEIKSLLYLTKFDKLNEAISLLYTSLNKNRNVSTVRRLITFLLFNKKIDEAKEVLSNNKIIFYREQILNIEKEILDEDKDYQGAYNKLIEIQNLNDFKKYKYISGLSYYLIHLKKYDDSIALLKEYLDLRNFDLSMESEIINYELSHKLLNSKYSVNKKRLELLMDSTNSRGTKAAIFSLLGKKDDAIDILKEKIEKDFSSKYEIRDWPVFTFIRNEKRFKNLFSI